MLEAVRKQGGRVQTLPLGPLTQEHCEELLTDTLSRSRADVLPLAAFCMRHTGGNPFFLGQYLLWLHEQGLFVFDGEEAHWRWDKGRVARAGASSNVVDLMTEKIQRLPVEAQRALQLAACIGGQFDLGTLSVVSGERAETALAELWPAMQEGLVIPLDDAYKLTEDRAAASRLLLDGEATPATDESPGPATFRFLHDRVHQAAYSLIPEGEREGLHLRIGRLLRDTTSAEQRDSRIFEIVSHLDRGARLIAGQDERDLLAELNLAAGKRAKSSAAHAAAAGFLATAVALLGEEGWQRRRALALDVHENAVEVAYLVGDYEGMDRYTDALLSRTTAIAEELRVYEIRIMAYNARTRMLDAVETALRVVARLGVRFPAAPGPAAVKAAVAATQAALGGRSMDELYAAPDMTDPDALAAMRILSIVTSACYVTRPELFPLVILEMTTLSARHGTTGASAFAYGLYGLILSSALGNIDSGCAFGGLALRLLDRGDAKAYGGRTRAIVHAFLTHLREPLRHAAQLFVEANRLALDDGDLEYAFHAAMWVTADSLFSGVDLEEVERIAARYVDMAGRYQQANTRQYMETSLAAVRSLLGTSPEPWRIAVGSYDFERMMEIHHAARDASGLGWAHVYKLFLACLFGRTAEALATLSFLEDNMATMIGTMYTGQVLFYGALARLHACQERARADGVLRRRGWTTACRSSASSPPTLP
jgi:predicted ATPase